MEGSRPVLVEVQALAAPTGYGTAQRVATGLDPKRLAVLLAVLERRGGASFGQQDVFVQVAGGLRLSEPAADLAVVAALLSSLHNRPTPADALYLGELGLGGEIRPLAGMERRLAEAGRLGFRRVISSSRSTAKVAGMTHQGLAGVDEVAGTLAA
jgi:DNA repair protein RadA/Sms